MISPETKNIQVRCTFKNKTCIKQLRRNSRLLFFILCCIAFLNGCATTLGQGPGHFDVLERRLHKDKYPVELGMTKEEVKLWWGRPADGSRIMTPQGEFAVYEYDEAGRYPSRLLYFKDGVLVAVQEI